MNTCRKEYKKRVDNFLQFACQNIELVDETYYYPCVCCRDHIPRFREICNLFIIGILKI